MENVVVRFVFLIFQRVKE